MNIGTSITIGIIGHLNSIVTDKHKSIIKEIFHDISMQYPNSPVTLFSQLAKGADTEVAKVFLDIKEKTKRDFRLIVPLPFDIEKYKTAFNKQELVTFNQILSKSEKSFVLKSAPNTSDNELYRQGGQFVADSSIILIALWDEIDNGKTGGTADIVNYVREGTFHNEVIDNIFDMKSDLISIPCNRESETKKEIKLESNYLSKLFKADPSIKKTLDKIERFNKEQNKLKKASITQSMDYLFPESDKLTKLELDLMKYYAMIDSFAIKFQKSNKRVIIGLFVFGILGFSFFEYYKQFGKFANVLASGIIILGFIFVFFEFSKFWKSHQKYIEARVLAEALRVQFFWNMSGQSKSVSEYILRIHKTEFNWVRHFLFSIFGLTYPEQSPCEESLELIANHWIKDQTNYFEKKISHLENQKIRFNRISIALFILSILFFIGIGILKAKGIDWIILQRLVVVDTIIFGIAILLRSYYDKMGYDQIGNQYELMHTIYQTAEDRITKINKNPSLSIQEKQNQKKKIFELTGKEALVENGNWYMIYKDKEPEIEGFG